ncbi:hypothetical protein ACJJTC_009820 [Scirpophaga incertulas]
MIKYSLICGFEAEARGCAPRPWVDNPTAAATCETSLPRQHSRKQSYTSRQPNPKTRIADRWGAPRQPAVIDRPSAPAPPPSNTRLRRSPSGSTTPQRPSTEPPANRSRARRTAFQLKHRDDFTLL